MLSPDQSLALLQKHKPLFLGYAARPLSEADTRCKIIDIIFKDILGWDEDNIIREEYIRGNGGHLYIDYVFQSDTNRFLIEAKKSGIYFSVPTTFRVLRRTGVLSQDPKTEKALQQANLYGKTRKIPVACITNGYQFLVFLVNSRYHQPDTYVFNGVEDIIAHFTLFTDVFGPCGHALRSLEEVFARQNRTPLRPIPQFSRKLTEILFHADERVNRNPMEVYLKPVISDYFTDLVADGKEKLLSECYCTNERTSQYEDQLTALLKDSLPRLDLPLQDSSFLTADFLKKEKEQRSLLNPAELLILVGGVGSGKTTFIHRFFRHVLPEGIRRKVIWINIDLLEYPSEEISSLINYILKEALVQIRQKYAFLQIDNWDTLQNIYQAEICRLQNGALKPLYEQDTSAYQREISAFLLAKVKEESVFGEDVLRYIAQNPLLEKRLCITIDNADHKSDLFQQGCINTAFLLASKIKSLTFVSLREESYWRLRHIKPFDAYHGYAYHIAAPSVATLLAKRIAVAGKHLGKHQITLHGENNFHYHIKVGQFLQIISQSLYNRTFLMNIKFFEALSANNLRFALQMLGTFLVSGHTDSREYIETYLNGGQNYRIPFRAFVHSIALGDYKYYHSEKSLLINILELEDDGFYSHFSKLRVISFLKDRMILDSPAGKGFVEVDELYQVFIPTCPNEKIFRKLLTPMLHHHLIEADNGFGSGDCAQYIKLTSAGYYYLEVLINQFTYLERICEDTPIKSGLFFQPLQEITRQMEAESKKARVLELRMRRLEVFLDYLEEEEKREATYIKGTTLEPYRYLPVIRTHLNSLDLT